LLLTFASLTGPLVQFATHLIADLGYAGVYLLTTMTSVIGVPGTEPTMLFAGFDVYQGNLTLIGIIVAGVAGDMTGASIAYAIGYFGQHELLEHQGSKLHVSPRRLNKAHEWFERYGSPTIFISRMLPVVRAVFPYAAGVARMPFWRFFLLATLGSIIWIGGLAVLGQAVGSQWPTWRHHLEYVDYAAVGVFVIVVAYVVVRWRSSRKTPPPPSGTATPPDSTPNRSAQPAADVVSD
jgi:membrane protein DedA with SNARE-associated domain